MIDVFNLALPYFGLIFIGFASGKLKRLPEHGLAWMSFFILYIALPALFFGILAKTPFEQLAQWSFIAATSLATLSAIVLSVVTGLVLLHGRLEQATLAGVAGGFGNVGYMGPGLAIAVIGAEATVPVALIFSFEALLVFAIVPILMSLGGSRAAGIAAALRKVVTSIVLNPLLVAAGLGVAAAALRLELPAALDAPAAISLRVGGALRSLRHRRHGGAQADSAAWRRSYWSSSPSSLSSTRSLCSPLLEG